MTEVSQMVNEGSSAWVTVSFLNADGVGAAPDSATWKLTDKKSGQVLQAETAIAAPGATNEITLTPVMNAIIDVTRSFEVRVITIRAVYGDDDEATACYEYRVKNLASVT